MLPDEGDGVVGDGDERSLHESPVPLESPQRLVEESLRSLRAELKPLLLLVRLLLVTLPIRNRDFRRK